MVREVCVHAVDECELPVTANMIVVRVRVENNDGTRRQLGRDFANIPDAHPRVEQESLFVADNEIGNDFFGLMRFIDGEDARRGFVDLEPRIDSQHTLERFVFRPGKGPAPFGDLRLRLRKSGWA